MIFFNTRNQPFTYYCHKPAQSAQKNSGYSFGPRVTSQQQRAVINSISAQPTPRLVPSTSPSTFANRSWRFLARELENVWLIRQCTCLNFTQAPTDKFVWVFKSKQKFKYICWIFPVKTQMQMNLFNFTCQNTKLESIFWILYQKVNLIWKKHDK